MKKKLLWVLAVLSICFSSSCFSIQLPEFLQEKTVINQYNWFIADVLPLLSPPPESILAPINPFNDINDMLQKERPVLNQLVINKVLTTLQCAQKYNVGHNNILTIIDYSLPSSEKRLWVFNLQEKKLLFHTYVSHGIKSGTLLSSFFSNINNSKASSLGVYKTEKPYYGRDGLSLRLDGLDNGFNDQAFNRYVVMHGSWYVEENFIKKYGRAGRSWGCPAVPLDLTKPIIDTIKDGSLFVAYYPSEKWFFKSKFLNCTMPSLIKDKSSVESATKPVVPENEIRDEVLFAKLNIKSKHEENEAIVVMSADNYERVFHNKPPLERMLRRQINHAEYIALSNTEFKNMLTNNTDGILHSVTNELDSIYFVIPVIKMQRGYYATEMKIINLGKIKEVRLNTNTTNRQTHTVFFESKPFVNLTPTNRFIRWLGL